MYDPWVVGIDVAFVKHLGEGHWGEVQVGDDVIVPLGQLPLEVGVLGLLGWHVVLVLLDVDYLVLEIDVQCEHAKHPYEGCKVLDVLILVRFVLHVAFLASLLFTIQGHISKVGCRTHENGLRINLLPSPITLWVKR